MTKDWAVPKEGRQGGGEEGFPVLILFGAVGG